MDHLPLLLLMVAVVGRPPQSNDGLRIHLCSHLERVAAISKRHSKDLVDQERANSMERCGTLTERLNGSLTAVSI